MAEYVEKICLFGTEAKIRPTILGEGEPTAETEGCVGAFYMDTNTKRMYMCTEHGVWEDLRYYVTPEMFGGVGDGVTDDGANLKAILENLNNFLTSA